MQMQPDFPTGIIKRAGRINNIRACSVNGPNPEEWREFRAKLISNGGLSGLRTTIDEKGTVPDNFTSDVTSQDPVSASKPVAPKNLELLQTQVRAMHLS